MDKPLITIVLVGKLEQQVLYEGIQKLCFGCGRVGHRRESCPFIICGPKPPEMGAPESHTMPVHAPHNRHDLSTFASADCIAGDMQERDVHKGDYGLWLVVTHKRSGHKSSKNQSTWVVKMGPTLLARMSHATSMDTGPLKDYKRKLTVNPNLLGPNASKLQASEFTKQVDQSSSSLGAGLTQPSSVLGASVKAKKKNARAKASDNSPINSTEGKQSPYFNITSWKENGESSFFNPNFQFTSAPKASKKLGRSD